MTPFRRRLAPDFWREHEARWRQRGAVLSARAALHGWRQGGESLARAFHRTVRVEGDPLLCAYCDGELGLTSGETIDHFLPESLCRALGLFELGLSWTNLFPACTACNSTFKRDRWSCLLLRPDVDPVSACFAFRPRTGEVYAAPEFDRVTRVRVTKTIHVFGLNTEVRRYARLRLLRDLVNAHACGDHERVAEMAEQGPYRFVARHFLETIG